MAVKVAVLDALAQLDALGRCAWCGSYDTLVDPFDVSCWSCETLIFSYPISNPIAHKDDE